MGNLGLKAEDGFGDEEYEHGDEESSPDFLGEGVGLALILEELVGCAFEQGVEAVCCDNLPLVLGLGSVGGAEPVAQLPNSGFVGGVAGG